MCGLPLIKKSFHLCVLKINWLISIWKEAGTISYPLLLYTQNYTDWIKLYILIHLAKLLIFLTILAYTCKTNCLLCICILSIWVWQQKQSGGNILKKKKNWNICLKRNSDNFQSFYKGLKWLTITANYENSTKGTTKVYIMTFQCLQ